jgi:hypothetical protein
MKKNVFITMALAAGLALTACNGEDYLENIPVEEILQQNVSPLTRGVVDPTTVEQFRRTYGVGFSYDGLWGEKCNLKDIRCQVFDLAKVNALSYEICEDLVLTSTDNQTKFEQTCSFSKSAYEQSVDFHADVNANLILINGKGEGKVSMWEGGQTNSFFCVSSAISPALSVRLEGASLAALIEDGRTEILSKNFLECCKWMETHTSELVVDSFLQRYGSHVVTYAVMGGRLDIEMRMNLDSLLDVTDTKVLGDLSMAEIVKMKAESESHKKELNLMNSAECRISICGGDVSLIPSSMMHFNFNEKPDLSSYATAWMASIKYDPDDYQNSNLEMTDMEIMPIWDFIPNKEVADRVKKRVMGSTADLLREVGYQNGVNTEINLSIESVNCKLANSRNFQSFKNAPMVNVICAGRYVASICWERIEDIDPHNDVKVVYPVYDREVNLSSGMCIHNGTAYQVRNLRNGYSVTKVGEAQDNKMYLNGGVPGITRFENVNYVQSYNLPAIELANSVKSDGSVGAQNIYQVYKSGLDFLLNNKDGKAQKGNVSGLPNWEYNRYYDRMVRNKTYKYYWNPKEINHQ